MPKMDLSREELIEIAKVPIETRRYITKLETELDWYRDANRGWQVKWEQLKAENKRLEENRVDLCVLLKEWQAFVHPARLKQINEETSQLLEKNMRPGTLPAEEETP